MYVSQVLFVSINADEEEHQRIIEFFGMKKDEIPAMRLIRLEEDMAKYKPQNPELSKDNIKAFVQDFIDGKLKVSIVRALKIMVFWNVLPCGLVDCCYHYQGRCYLLHKSTLLRLKWRPHISLKQW
jgi:hypothetical protein